MQDLVTIQFYFQKTELIVTFPIVLLGITFGNLIGRFPHNATDELKKLGLTLFFVQVEFETGQSFVEFLSYEAIF